MNQLSLHEPRDSTRAAFQIAILTAPTEGARNAFAASLQWYEWKWAAQDQQRQQAAQQEAQPPPSPTPPSAVEQHGIDSPQAAAKRQQRAARRAAAKAGQGETKDKGK